MNSSNHEKADDSSTVFDADTVTPDEVPSLPTLTATETATATTDYLYNNINESTTSTSIQEESPANTISEFIRRFNSTRHRPTVPSTITITTAAATRSQEISINESSSSSSKKRPIITNSSSSHQSRKRPRQSCSLKRQQPQDQSCVDKSDSAVEGENGFEDDEPNEEISTNQSSSSQTSTTKKLTKYEARWKSKFQELCAFKQLHGNTDVSTYDEDNKQLGLWVSTQRREYKKFKANKKAKITKERIQTLESIGFEWVLNRGSQRNESAWIKRFNELKDYKELHEHTNVPQSSEDYKQLGVWVSNQRTKYRNFQANKKSQITSERIELLELIGFEWELQFEWNKRFNELKDYKEKYGRTNVPAHNKDNKQLGIWVQTQRAQYKKFKKNEKAYITLERINMLNSIGFQWECCPGRAHQV